MNLSKLGIVFLFISIPLAVKGQENTISFPSSDLQQIALTYAGNSLYWPIIVSLADHDIPKNTFTLGGSDLLQLQNFSKTSFKVQQSDTKLKELISSGATIFAKEPLVKATELKNQFIEHIQDGNLTSAIELGEQLPTVVLEVERTLSENRLVQVQAQLAEKEGTVDKRLGLLGSWNEALVGELFEESDGLRTLKESYASLEFTDGSSITVDPNTVAIIRKSRIDKLDESADTEISLVQGGLLAKLSAAGKEKSTYILNAGTSTSDLKTQNFYAESDGNETVKLTNYDGYADISANDITVSLKKNEGTIVRDGNAPAPPIKLLPAPELAWASKDTIIYNENIIFAFNKVEKAVSYKVQYSTSSSFTTDIKELTVTSNTVSISNLKLGTTYIKVQAVDNLGLRGPFTETIRVIRNIDNQPPPIFIDDLSGNIIFTLDNSIIINGVTEPDASLKIDGKKIPIQVSGKFMYQANNLSLDQTISLTSLDGSGNETVKNIRIVKLTNEVLFNFSLSGASGSDIIQVRNPTVTISSNAYPGLEVIINNEDSIRRVQTDSRGRWGITMNMQEGKLSVTFKDIHTGVNYLTKSFTVQAN